MRADSSDWDTLCWTSAFAAGRASPADLLETCLRRIDRYDSELGICNHLADREALFDEAAASAARWWKGAPRSPLDGVPFGVKANIAVGGFPWHGGIAAFRERRASEDADCVQRLREAGMIPMAVFNMHEAAFGVTTKNLAFRTTRNPHDAGRLPGGSSGGSAAAVAAGFAPVALGTDSLGSVRLPSALCGVVGFKPGRDEIPMQGVMPLCRQLDHLGVHGRSVGDVMAVMQLFWDGRKPLYDEAAADRHAVERSRLASWVVADGEAESTAVAEAFDRVIEEQGLTRRADWTDVDLSAVRRAGVLLCERDGARLFARELRDRPEGFSATFRRLVEWGAAQPLEKLQRAETLLAETSRRLRADLRGNLLLSPTTVHLAPVRGDPVPVALANLTAPAAIAGIPAISVPMRAQGMRLPMGLQITGLAGAAVLRTARDFFPGVAACVP